MIGFCIHFLNFGVFVHHSQGVTLVLGSAGHSLHYMVMGGGCRPVPQGTHIDLRGTDSDGKPVPRDRTRSHADSYMVDLEWIKGAPVMIDREKVVGGDQTHQNGRVHLHGGDLLDHPAGALDEPNVLCDALWNFSSFGAKPPSLHRISNRASFLRNIKHGETWALHIGADVIPLGAGSQVVIENRDKADKEECEDLSSGEPGAIDEEMLRLLPAVGVPSSGGHSVLSIVPPFVPPPGKICQPCALLESYQSF